MVRPAAKLGDEIADRYGIVRDQLGRVSTHGGYSTLYDHLQLWILFQACREFVRRNSR
jgi:hypothetical protein